MKLYINPLSSNARKVMSLVAHLGMDAEQITLDFAKGEHRAPSFLAINPNGKVPTLVDDDFVLWESNAILKYLAAKDPDARLVPKDIKGQAEVDRWLFWQSSHFGPALGKLLFEHLIKPMLLGDDNPDQGVIKTAQEEVTRFASVLDAHLEGRDYVCGNLTVADFALGIWAEYAPMARADLSSYANINRWLDRLRGLDGWAGAPTLG